ncbi:hypothetical protein G3A42_41670 [Paraburkholderia aspalathi]|nr:hypothetical protein [Paraburkholderia aspalathi]
MTDFPGVPDASGKVHDPLQALPDCLDAWLTIQGFRMKKPVNKGPQRLLTLADSGLLSIFAGTRDAVDHGCVCRVA